MFFKIHRWLTSFFMILILILVAFSLAFYNQHDPSFIYSSSENILINNKLGSLGAYISGILLYFFGCSVLFFIPLFIMFFIAVTNQNYFKDTFKNNIERFAALILLVPTIASLFNLLKFEIFSGIYPGGVVGVLLSNFLLKLFLDNHAIGLLCICLWSIIILVDRFYSVRFVIAATNILKLIPFDTIFSYLGNLSLSFLDFIKRFLTKQIDRFTKDPEDDEDIEIQKIYNDPFWELYFEPANSSESVINCDSTNVNNNISSNSTDNSLKSTAQNAQVSFKTSNLAQDLDTNLSNNLDFTSSYILPNLTNFFNNISDINNNSRQKTDQKNIEQILKQETEAENQKQANILEDKLEHFGVKGKVTLITHGPVVTLFEYQPSVETKISNILARENDLALALQAISLRTIAPIPGKSTVGFEVAHKKRQPVLFSKIVQSTDFIRYPGNLPLILGKDTLGSDIIIDLASMPHLLVAGSTGSGKSVGLNSMIMSLLCSKSPDELKLILIDPKRLEFALFQDMAHLVFPVITEPAKAVSALKWAVATMEKRYSIMAQVGVRNIDQFRALNLEDINNKNNNIEKMPYIVIIIDELADLMMTASKEVEVLIARIAQMARAAGIHLIIATQRPSVDVITGLIKVNFPSRIAYKVTSKIDSRTILDLSGAEKLLGKGDMLYLDTKGSVNRVHGALVTDKEIISIIDYIKSQRTVKYENLSSATKEIQAFEDQDELYEDILDFIKQRDEVSISLVQRAFRIGYNRSARIMEQLEQEGFVVQIDGSKMRKVIKE